MTFLRIFRHLLPRARAWRMTVDKPLRQFFDGLAATGDDVKQFLDQIWLDIFPETTRELTDWEAQFGLKAGQLTEQERRDRLSGAWKALGGQSPRYIRDTMQAAGFNVHVHEWWEPTAWPMYATYSGEALAECGEALAECTQVIPSARDPLTYLSESSTERVPGLGYPLVNRLTVTSKDFTIICGEALAECGEALAECGGFDGFRADPVEYLVPDDSTKWPFFLYIGAETFGDMADVPAERQQEFEDLLLKICPAQQWLGVLVNYV